MRWARPLLSPLAIAELSEGKEVTASSGWGGRVPGPAQPFCRGHRTGHHTLMN